MSCVTVTKHGERRIKERAGLKRKAVESNVQKALNEGLSRTETSGSLRRYLDSVFFKGDRRQSKPHNIKIWNNMVYIFVSYDILLTAIPLPTKYQKTVKALFEKRREGS